MTSVFLLDVYMAIERGLAPFLGQYKVNWILTQKLPISRQDGY
jgi:hypothetical protein